MQTEVYVHMQLRGTRIKGFSLGSFVEDSFIIIRTGTSHNLFFNRK